MELNLIRRNDGLLEAVDDKSMEGIDGLPYRPMRFTVNIKRSLSQNALKEVWYNQVDKHFSLETGTTMRQCKLHFGVPILRAENEQFRRLYDKTMIRVLTYEEKLEAMDILPVTSLMNKSQMTRYIEQVQVHYGKHGVVLESKD